MEKLKAINMFSNLFIANYSYWHSKL